MIIEHESVEKFGSIPSLVLHLAKEASEHSRLFSQDKKSLFVHYKENSNKDLSGWAIVDNYRRTIYDGILVVNNKDSFIISSKDNKIHKYAQSKNVFIHASQFFMMGITKVLV